MLWIGSVGAANWAARPTLLSLGNGRDIHRTDNNLTVEPGRTHIHSRVPWLASLHHHWPAASVVIALSPR